MIVDATRTLNKIEIRCPRWKQRVIGVASYRIKEENEIQITAISPKDGRRYYPDPFYATREQIVKNETQTLPDGTKLFLVPISSLEVLERK